MTKNSHLASLIDIVLLFAVCRVSYGLSVVVPELFVRLRMTPVVEISADQVGFIHFAWNFSPGALGSMGGSETPVALIEVVGYDGVVFCVGDWPPQVQDESMRSALEIRMIFFI